MKTLSNLNKALLYKWSLMYEKLFLFLFYEWSLQYANEKEVWYIEVIRGKYGEKEGWQSSSVPREGLQVGLWKVLRKWRQLVSNKFVFCGRDWKEGRVLHNQMVQRFPSEHWFSLFVYFCQHIGGLGAGYMEHGTRCRMLEPYFIFQIVRLLLWLRERRVTQGMQDKV